MSDPTKSPDATENQPADAKLIQQRPDLFDKSLVGQVMPPAPAPPAAPPTPAQAAESLSQDPDEKVGPTLEELNGRLLGLDADRTAREVVAAAGEVDAGEAIDDRGDAEEARMAGERVLGHPGEPAAPLHAPDEPDGAPVSVDTLEQGAPPDAPPGPSSMGEAERAPGRPRKPGVPKR